MEGKYVPTLTHPSVHHRIIEAEGNMPPTIGSFIFPSFHSIFPSLSFLFFFLSLYPSLHLPSPISSFHLPLLLLILLYPILTSLNSLSEIIYNVI
jgi:hypothetical protein